MSRAGKRLRSAREVVGESVLEPASAIVALKGVATARFDETVEIAVRLGVDPRHADQTVRGVCKLPHGTGRRVRVAVFARGVLADQARQAGAEVVGAEDLMESMQKGNIDYDRVIASPDMMALVGRLGKILGPRGLMPNPRVGTVSPDPASAVSDAMSGAVEFRAEKAGIVHAGIGKASFGSQELEENMKAFIVALVEARPSGAKGSYVRGVCLSTTMGPSVGVDIQQGACHDWISMR